MDKNAAETDSTEFYQNVLRRWRESNLSGEEYEKHFLSLQKEFRKYYANIFILNHKALIIQHAYFKVKAGQREITPTHIMKLRQTKSSSSIHFKPKYKLDHCNLVVNTRRQGLKPPKAYKRDSEDRNTSLSSKTSESVRPGTAKCNLLNPPKAENAYKMVTPRNNCSAMGEKNQESIKISQAIESAVSRYNTADRTRTSQRRKHNFSSLPKSNHSQSRTGSSLNKIKDDEYEKQILEKQKRVNRLKEARRKYSKQKLKSKQRNDSCTSSTSRPADLSKIPTVRGGKKQRSSNSRDFEGKFIHHLTSKTSSEV